MKLLFSLVFMVSFTVAIAGDASANAKEHRIQFTGEYYTAKQVSVLPKAEKRVPPRFPTVQRRAGRSGVARVAFIVNEKGFTEELHVVDATEKAFGDAAVEAIQKWQFTPGEIEGRCVRVVQVVDVPFTVNDRR